MTTPRWEILCFLSSHIALAIVTAPHSMLTGIQQVDLSTSFSEGENSDCQDAAAVATHE